MAKNRDLVFVVIRRYGILNNFHVIDVCRTLERAEELRDAYQFDFQERGLVGFKFEVQVGSYVDEWNLYV